MTARIVNGNYTNGITAFRSPAMPTNPLPFLIALYDCVREQGNDWLRTDEGKALLFPILMMAYGAMFDLDSVAEFARLDKVIPRA